jgi:hypothetical protein
MGYYVRLARLIPEHPSDDREHLRELIRFLYFTILHFGILLVASPGIRSYAGVAAKLRADLLSNEKEITVFKATWIKRKLDEAPASVEEARDSDTSTSTRHGDMESGSDASTFGHPASPGQLVSPLKHPCPIKITYTGQADDCAPSANPAESASPVVQYFHPRSPTESICDGRHFC